MSEILKKENILLNLGKASREDAIRMCGQMLVASGYANEQYIEGMLKRDNSFSTNIGNFIAIPHGDESYKKDILKTGLAVLTFPQGIDWQGSPVYLVIGIAAKGDEHLDIMGNIVDNLETEEDTINFVKNATIKSVYKMLTGSMK